MLLFLVVSLWSNAQETKRVISLAPSITEIIYELGVESKLVGCTSYCTPAVEDGVEQVGSTVEVNIEKIFSLKPDLVLAMELTKPQDLAAMRKLGMNVILLKTPVSFKEICDQALQIGELTGNSAKAKKIIIEITHKVDSLKKYNSNLNKSEIFFQLGANPVFTVLEGTFMNDFITFCNGENIAAGLKHGTITRESVLVKNPDIIIIATMGGFGEEEMKVWNSYKGIEAVKKGKVFLVDSETSCVPTPGNFLKALTDITNNINR